MKRYILIFGLMVVALVASLPSLSKPEPPRDHFLAHEIMVDGPALFYSVRNDIRRELWAVHCAQPLRGCIARAPGLVVRLDDLRQPWLIAAAGPRAHVTVRLGNLSQNMPDLFARPLTPKLQERLSRPESFIRIEEHGQILLHTRTEALVRVVSYLRWLDSATARTLRDARLWPDGGRLDPESMTPEVLERYELLQRRRKAMQRAPAPEPEQHVRFAPWSPDGLPLYTDDRGS